MSLNPVHNSSRPWFSDVVVWQQMVSGDEFTAVPTSFGFVTVYLNHVTQSLHLQFAYKGTIYTRRYTEVRYSRAYAVDLARRLATESVAKENMGALR